MLTLSVRSLKTEAPAWKLGNGTTQLVVPLVAMEWFEIEGGNRKRRWGARMQLPKHGNFGIAP